MIPGVDTIKSAVMDRLHRARGLRFSDSLAEALATVTYAWAAHQLAAVSFEAREAMLRYGLPPPTIPAQVSSPWVAAW